MKTKLMCDGFEGHVQRSLDRSARRAKGERLQAEKIINFADPLHLFECMTVQRVRLYQTAGKNR